MLYNNHNKYYFLVIFSSNYSISFSILCKNNIWLTFPPCLVLSFRKLKTFRGSEGSIPSTLITAKPLLLRPNLHLDIVIPSLVSGLIQLAVSDNWHKPSHCYNHIMNWIKVIVVIVAKINVYYYSYKSLL